MMNRRTLFNATLAGSAAALLGAPAIRAATGSGSSSSGGSWRGRPLTPFVDPLPLPPAPTPYEWDHGRMPKEFGNLSSDARSHVDLTGSHGNKPRFYKIIAEVRHVKFHSALPHTEIWGYKDANRAGEWEYALGPTFIEHMSNHTEKHGVVVRFENKLPKDHEHRGFGEPKCSVHMHGAHVPYQFDGFPEKIEYPRGAIFQPAFHSGEHYDYVYPLVDPNFITDRQRTLNDPADPLHGMHTERPSTLWYHDHIIDHTAENVYRGLAGFFLVYDKQVIKEHDPFEGNGVKDQILDTGDERDTLSTALRLPSGDFDVPLILHEKTFGPNGELVYNALNNDGFMGEHYLVNGRVQPYLDVKRRKYRFRFLNGSNARIYQLFLTDNSGRSYPMTQIATEGGLLSRPIVRHSFLLAMAERVEVVIDFSKFPHPQVTELFIENRLVQEDGRGPEGTLERPKLTEKGTRVLKFKLGERVYDDYSRVPSSLRPFTAICRPDLDRARVRTFEFERKNGLWAINGQLAGKLENPMFTVPGDRGEVWRFVNKSGGWWHPIHVHHEFMRVLKRNGREPFGGTGPDHGQPVERDGVARKDTITLGPNSEVEVYVRFGDYEGPFVFHCHNMEHEDHAMMTRFDVGKIDPEPQNAFCRR